MNQILLDKRLSNYVRNVWLKNADSNVTRDTLFALAINKGFKKTDIWDAIKKMETNLNIARHYEDGITYYTFLNLSKKEVNKLKADIKWFDSLPENNK